METESNGEMPFLCIFFPVLSPAQQNDRLLQLASFLRMPLSAKTGIVCSIPLFPSATSLLLAGTASAAMCCSLLQQSCTHRLGRRTKLKEELGTIQCKLPWDQIEPSHCSPSNIVFVFKQYPNAGSKFQVLFVLGSSVGQTIQSKLPRALPQGG